MDEDISKVPISRWQNALTNTSKNFGSHDSALSTTTITAHAAASNQPLQKCKTVNFQGKSPGIVFYANRSLSFKIESMKFQLK